MIRKLLVAVVAVCLVAAPIMGPATTQATASTATQGPSGMVAVPDENISIEVPDGESIPLDASDLYGKLYADQYASSMDVTVTTPEHAQELVNQSGDANVVGGGEIAVVAADSDHHSGRDVAVDASLLKDTLGYSPKMLYGTHSSGETWRSPATYEDGYLQFHVERFSSNAVTFSGSVSVQGTYGPDSSVQYNLSELDSASDPVVNLTGAIASETETVAASGLTDGDSVDASIAGNVDPANTTLTLEGNQYTGSQYTETGTGDGSFSVVGDTAPSGPESGEPRIVLDGRESTGSQTTASGTDGDTIHPAGNVAPVGPSAGNEPEITFTGSVSTNWDNRSATGLRDAGSLPLNPDGNLEPYGPSTNDQPVVEFTGNFWSGSHSIVDDEGDGGTDQSEDLSCFGEADTNRYKCAAEFVPSSTGTLQNITVDTLVDQDDSDTWTPNVDVYIRKGNVNTDWTDGTLVKSSWSPTISTDTKTISISEVNVTRGDTYEVSFVTTNTDNDGNYDSMSIAADTSASSTKAAYSNQYDNRYKEEKYLNISFGVSSQTVDPGIDVTGDGTADALYNGTLADGETTTLEVADLSKDQSTATVSLSAGHVDVTLRKEERTATEDPSVDIDGDGTAEASQTGILKSGETATVELAALDDTQQTVDLQTMRGPTPDWDLTYSPVTATEDPTVDVNGDGTADASYSGVLQSGETATLQLGALTDGSTTLNSNVVAGPQPTWTITYDAEHYTDSPSVDVDGDGTAEASYNGTLGPGETSQTTVSPSLSNDTWTVSSAGGPVDLSADITERTQTTDISIGLNTADGGQWANHTGTLADGDTVSLSLNQSTLQEGTNTVTVDVGDGSLSADAPTPKVDLDYSHDAAAEKHVDYTAEYLSERYNISHTYASDRSQATLTVPFAQDVIAIRSVEQRTDGGSWQSVSESDYSLDGTTMTVQLGAVPANTTVDVRANGSTVDAQDVSLSVVEPTDPGDRLDSQVELSNIGANPRLEIADDRLAYAYNASWDLGDSTRATTSGQYLRLPNAPDGGRMRLSTIPVSVEPATNDVIITVEDPQTSEPSFTVSPGDQSGDGVQYTYIDAQDDTEYILYSKSEGVVRDTGTANSPLTLEDDDSSETLQFLVDDSGSSSSDTTNSGVLGPIGGAAQQAEQVVNVDLGSTWLLVLAVGGLVLVGVIYWRGGEDELEATAAGTASTTSQAASAGASGLQAAAGWTASAVTGAATWTARGLARMAGWFASHPYVTAGVAAAGGLALFAAGVVSLPEGAGVFIVVTGVPIVAYVVLVRYFGASTLVWGVITGVSMILGFQLLGTDVFTVLAGSQAFPILAAGLVYILYQAIQAYRTSESTPEEQNTIVFETDGGDDENGGGGS